LNRRQVLLHFFELSNQLDASLVCRGLFRQFLNDPIKKRPVKIISAEFRISIGRKHFDNRSGDFKNRNIESAASKIIDSDQRSLLLSAEAIGQCCGRWFIQNSYNFESCKSAR